MVVLLDPSEDPDDILRANRSRERRYVFDHAFDETAGQVRIPQTQFCRCNSQNPDYISVRLT